MKAAVRKIERDEWKAAMSRKTSLRLYSNNKDEIRKDRQWKNTSRERIERLFQCCAMPLNKMRGKTEEEKKCKCGTEDEDVEHIMLRCKEYVEERKKYNINGEEDLSTIMKENKEWIRFAEEVYIKGLNDYDQLLADIKAKSKKTYQSINQLLYYKYITYVHPFMSIVST